MDGASDGIGWEGEGIGGDGREGEEHGRGEGSEGRGGEGLLNFHLIFQKSWAEPGNPS